MLRPYPNATCRRSSRSDLSVQQGADAERPTPTAFVTDDVGLVGRAWHEIHMTVEPDGEPLAEPLPHTNLPPNAAVVRLVRARVGILHVSDRREELGAACGRHVVDEPDVQRAVFRAVLRGAGDVDLERDVAERIHANTPTESERVADGERVVGVEIRSERADFERACLLRSRGHRGGTRCSDNDHEDAESHDGPLLGLMAGSESDARNGRTVES